MKTMMLAVLMAAITTVPLAASAQPTTSAQRQEVEWNQACLARHDNVPVREAIQICVQEYLSERQAASTVAPARQETPQQAAYRLCVSRTVEHTELRGLPQIWGLPASGPHITDIRPGPAFPDPTVGPGGARCYVTVILSQPSGLFPPVMVGAVVVRLLQNGDIAIWWSPR